MKKLDLLVREYKMTESNVERNYILSQIITESKNTLSYMSNKFSNIPNADEEDKYSIMLEALSKAVVNYDIENSTKFNTYLSRCIEQKLIKLYQDNTRAKRVVADNEGGFIKNLSYETLTEAGAEGTSIIEGEIEEDYSMIELDMLFNKLDLGERERYICEKFAEGWSSSEIAKSLEVAPANITYFVKKLRKKLEPVYFATCV